MGTMITLALGRLEVDWGKNDLFMDHGALYQQSDIKPVPTYYAGPDWPDGEPIVEMHEGLGKPLGKVTLVQISHKRGRVDLVRFGLSNNRTRRTRP